MRAADFIATNRVGIAIFAVGLTAWITALWTIFRNPKFRRQWRGAMLASVASPFRPPRSAAPRMYDGPTSWTTVKYIPDNTGLWRVVVEERAEQNLFRFCVERYFFPAPEDEGQWPDGCWQPEVISGLYGTAAEVEAAARDELTKWSV